MTAAVVVVVVCVRLSVCNDNDDKRTERRNSIFLQSPANCLKHVRSSATEVGTALHSTLWYALPEGPLFSQVLFFPGLWLSCYACTVQSICAFAQQHRIGAVSISDPLSTPCQMPFLGQSILQVFASCLGRRLQ